MSAQTAKDKFFAELFLTLFMVLMVLVYTELLLRANEVNDEREHHLRGANRDMV